MTGRRSAHWSVDHRFGSAADLQAPWPDDALCGSRLVRVCRVSGRPAVVLGSTQDPATVDATRAAAAGIDIVRRPTGGGAVWVAPGAQVWLDLWIPRTDELWDADVVHAATWLGLTWATALTNLGAGPARVHRGPSTRSMWAKLVCFAGVGPGEVTIGGAKVVGLAQRRSRYGARFHAAAPLEWDPTALLAVLDAPPADALSYVYGAAVGLREVLRPARSNLCGDELVSAVEDAFVSALP